MAKWIGITFGIAQAIAGAGNDRVIPLLKQVYTDYIGDSREKVVCVLRDYRTLVLGKGGKEKVNFSMKDVVKQLAKEGYSVKDIMAIAHNHPKFDRQFSDEDRDMYNKFRQFGFNGRFLLYYPERGLIYEDKDLYKGDKK